MRRLKVEAWECGECGVGVDTDLLFAWCDGCSKVLCVSCIDDGTTCDGCDIIVCRSCATRAFALECQGCGAPMHTDCFSRRKDVGHALCDGCARSAASMWA